MLFDPSPPMGLPCRAHFPTSRAVFTKCSGKRLPGQSGRKNSALENAGRSLRSRCRPHSSFLKPTQRPERTSFGSVGRTCTASSRWRDTRRQPTDGPAACDRRNTGRRVRVQPASGLNLYLPSENLTTGRFTLPPPWKRLRARDPRFENLQVRDPGGGPALRSRRRDRSC